MKIGQLNLGGGNKVHTVSGFEQVFFELRQLSGASQGILIRYSRDPPFLIPAGSVGVCHEVNEGAL